MSHPAPYDPELRGDTPLTRKLIARIRADGPISVDDYMNACLNDPEFGYYRTQTAIGGTGDFITAPEISQVFGELIGLWCAVVWQQMGSPAAVNLVELGGGRGTLLSDALRATRGVPGFRDAVCVHILDRNPVLIAQQRATLSPTGARVTWHDDFASLPDTAPSIWLANEFLDTLPVRQQLCIDGRWRDRSIGIDAAGRLAFEEPGGANDAIRETQDIRPIVEAFRARATGHACAALFLDYGYVGGAQTDTLQAVRDHRPEHVLTSPGEADLSCHVDFAALAAQTIATADLAVDGPVTQAAFLGELGIMERASRLMAANPAHANMLEMSVARLMAPQGMGTRFKVIALRSAGLPALPGFSDAP